MAVDPEVYAKIAADPYVQSLGVEIEEIAAGYSRLSLTVRPEMVNFHGIGHGAVAFALADAAFAAAGNGHGTPAVALTVSIDFLAPFHPGDRLVAEAHELDLGRRTGLYHLTVRNGNGRLIASCQARAYRKNDHA